MAITEEQVKHVTKLSKLSFSEEELADFTDQLDKIINIVELLEEVDITGVLFTSDMSESINVVREDVAAPGMDRKRLMWNIPEPENGYIKVPAIMDNGEVGAQWKNYTTNR